MNITVSPSTCIDFDLLWVMQNLPPTLFSCASDESHSEPDSFVMLKEALDFVLSAIICFGIFCHAAKSSFLKDLY
jgi:hypothetical protein